jgi:hypothetical protein
MQVTKNADEAGEVDTEKADTEKADAAKADADQEKGCDKPKKVQKGLEEFEVNKSAPEEFGGWKQTTKSFWMGVL